MSERNSPLHQGESGQSRGKSMYAPEKFEPCPIHAYGTCLSSVITEHSQNTKIPVEMVAPIALAAMASAAQNLYNIRRPGMSPSPISLNVILIAGSGEGKDASASPLLRPFHDFDRKTASEFRSAKVNLAVEKKMWDMKRKDLEAKYQKKLGNQRVADRAKRDFENLYRSQPRLATVPKLIFSDATPTAVKQSLCLRWPSSLLYSMEASGFFKGSLMRDMTFWNDLWGGAPIYLDRANTKEHVSVSAPRMSMILGIQPGMLERFMDRRGREAEESGLINRFLWTSPPPSSGYRTLDENPKTTVHLSTYSERCTELLEESASLSRGIDDERCALDFSKNAQKLFRDAFNDAQFDMRPDGRYQHMDGFAAKLTEQASRISAVLHVADGFDGSITDETLNRAIEIVRWHARQYHRLVSSASLRERLTRDAHHLHGRFYDLAQQGQFLVTLKDLQFLFLEEDWKRLRIERALKILIDFSHVVEHPVGRTKYYRLRGNPSPAPEGSAAKTPKDLFKAQLVKKSLDSLE
ncbi:MULTISPECIES: YfjI family protein [Variovorax]|uniref:YfjI family protein n=1 Tax=Variovorax TaxID=34072 RepID=UPI0013302588|nr:YfjI family protein [Variovorax boronicumulans]